jgi:hypothetical protein
VVAFKIENNAASERYCVTLHLAPGVDAEGKTVVPSQDIVLNNRNPIPGKKTDWYIGEIPGYKCNVGLVCFGPAGPEEFGVFPKGAPCPPGQQCSTITYNVKASDPCPDTTRQIASKCRHQQICIQGRGATLTCIEGCPANCGSTVKLQLCGSGGTVTKLVLKDENGIEVPADGPIVNNCWPPIRLLSRRTKPLRA